MTTSIYKNEDMLSLMMSNAGRTDLALTRVLLVSGQIFLFFFIFYDVRAHVGPTPCEGMVRPLQNSSPDDYVVYLQVSKFYLRIDEDLVLFSHVTESQNSAKWIDTIKEESKFMNQNKVFGPLKYLKRIKKKFGCKWIF